MELQLESVSRGFGRQIALADITTTVSEGAVAAVLGANGAGKSTLLRLIAGWLPATRGHIWLGKETVKPSHAAIRRQIMLLEEPRACESRAIDVITQIVALYQVDRPGIESEVADLMEQLDLLGLYNKRSRDVSKGQRYKLSLIALFVVAPKLWLLDEPFSCGLDAGGLQILESKIDRHVRGGGTVVFSTQWPNHARRLATQAMVLDQGKLVWDAATDVTPDEQLGDQASAPLRAVLRGLSSHTGSSHAGSSGDGI